MRHLLCAAIAAVMCASGTSQAVTLLGAAYDGNTGNGGKDADIAGGSPTAVVPGLATIDNVVKKYGAGSLYTQPVTSGNKGVKYSTTGNFNPLAGTIEMWMRLPSWNGQRQDLFSIFAGGYTGDFSLYLDPSQSNGRLHAIVDSTDGVTPIQWRQIGYQNGNYFADGNWHHVAWEWDTTAGFSTLYVDGVAENYNTIGTVSYNGTLGSTLEIGSRQGGYDNFQGYIDDVRISSTALYHQVSSFTPPGPIVVPEPMSFAIAIPALLLLRRRV